VLIEDCLEIFIISKIDIGIDPKLVILHLLLNKHKYRMSINWVKVSDKQPEPKLKNILVYNKEYGIYGTMFVHWGESVEQMSERDEFDGRPGDAGECWINDACIEIDFTHWAALNVPTD